MFRSTFFVSLMGLACLSEVGQGVALDSDELLAGIGHENAGDNLLPEIFSAQGGSDDENKRPAKRRKGFGGVYQPPQQRQTSLSEKNQPAPAKQG